VCLGRPQSGGLFCDGDIQTLEIPFDSPDTDPGPAYGPVPRHLGHAWLRLDPSPPAPLASDNLVSLLEGSLSFAIFTLLLLLPSVLPHGVLQSRSLEFTAGRRLVGLLTFELFWLT
jgi:hypothetical protein